MANERIKRTSQGRRGSADREMAGGWRERENWGEILELIDVNGERDRAGDEMSQIEEKVGRDIREVALNEGGTKRWKSQD